MQENNVVDKVKLMLLKYGSAAHTLFSWKYLFSKAKDIASTQLIRYMFTVGLVTVITSGFGFYKETVIASTIGLSELLDTFYIAVLIPGFIQTVFIGSLTSLFIPNYITELSTTNRKGEFQAVSFLIIAVLSAVLTLLCLVFSIYFLELVFPGHDTAYYNLIRTQMYIILPCLIFWGYASMLGGLLDINNKFFISSISPIFNTFTILICLFFFRDYLQEKVLAVGLLSGSVCVFLYLLVFTIREKALFLQKPKLNSNMWVMIQQLPPKITSALLTGLNGFVDQFFAVQLVVGSISAINYGIKLPVFTVSIIIIVIGTVLLPHFSRLVNTDMQKAYDQLFQILKIVFFGSLFVTILTFIFSDELIWLLFERKEFKPEDTLIVSKIQQITLVYVPFYICTLVCVKFLTAINKNKFMAWTSFWNLLLNLTLNIILVKYYGVYGLVASTTIVYIIASFIYVGFTIRQFRVYLAAKGQI